MPRGNPSPKLAITIDPSIHENILAAAAREGVSVSAWMTNAAREALRRRAGLAAVRHGLGVSHAQRMHVVSLQEIFETPCPPALLQVEVPNVRGRSPAIIK